MSCGRTGDKHRVPLVLRQVEKSRDVIPPLASPFIALI